MEFVIDILDTWKAYVNGMTDYRTRNIIPSHTYQFVLFRSLRELWDEVKEIMVELWHFRLMSAAEEFCDTWHALIVSLILLLLPRSVYMSPYVWVAAFWIGGFFTPYKHGKRYQEHGCIRSMRHCKKKDHACGSSLEFEE